jgi:hypothetical protein
LTAASSLPPFVASLSCLPVPMKKNIVIDCENRPMTTVVSAKRMCWGRVDGRGQEAGDHRCDESGDGEERRDQEELGHSSEQL